MDKIHWRRVYNDVTVSDWQLLPDLQSNNAIDLFLYLYDDWKQYDPVVCPQLTFSTFDCTVLQDQYHYQYNNIIGHESLMPVTLWKNCIEKNYFGKGRKPAALDVMNSLLHDGYDFKKYPNALKVFKITEFNFR